MLSFIAFLVEQFRLFEAFGPSVVKIRSIQQLKQLAKDSYDHHARWVVDDTGDIFAARASDHTHTEIMAASGVAAGGSLEGHITFENGTFYFYISSGDPRDHRDTLMAFDRNGIRRGDERDTRWMMQLGYAGAGAW